MAKGKPIYQSDADAVRRLSLLLADIDITFPQADFEWCEYVDPELKELGLDPVTGVVIIDVDDNAIIILSGCDAVIMETVSCDNEYSFASNASYEDRAGLVHDLIRSFLRHDKKLSPVKQLRKLID